MVDILDPRANYLVNPRIEVKIFSDTDLVFESQKTDLKNPYPTGFKDLSMDFEIEKDMEEEPNEAHVTIYNLNSDSRNQMVKASEQNAPIEIRLTPGGVDELSLAFKGEIDSVKNYPIKPGHATEIHCTSQKTQHLYAYIDRRTYIKGTSLRTIANDFIDAIGMPVQINSSTVTVFGSVQEGTVVETGVMQSQIPDTGILLSRSYGGPAFPLLKRFVQDLGLYCFINDGVLHISSIYVPQIQVPKEISKKSLLGSPQETELRDAVDVEMRTFSRVANIDPLKRIRRRKKKTKDEKIVGKSDYVSYKVVDQSIKGMDFEMFCRPDLNPDDLVKFPDLDDIKDTQYRVRSVRHFGDNETFDDWTTVIETSVYDSNGSII